MTMRVRPIFCGNLEFDARQSDVERLFRRYGRVDRVDMKSGCWWEQIVEMMDHLLYMWRVFLLSVLRFNPDVVLFLDDYFDGGHVLSDEEWKESLGLRHIFNLKALQKVYYLSGNHDTGYAAFISRKPGVSFGEKNLEVAGAVRRLE